MKEKAPQQLPYTPTISLGAEGKTLALTQKRKIDELHPRFKGPHLNEEENPRRKSPVPKGESIWR